jgi:hypothetical protein
MAVAIGKSAHCVFTFDLPRAGAKQSAPIIAPRLYRPKTVSRSGAATSGIDGSVPLGIASGIDVKSFSHTFLAACSAGGASMLALDPHNSFFGARQMKALNR